MQRFCQLTLLIFVIFQSKLSFGESLVQLLSQAKMHDYALLSAKENLNSREANTDVERSRLFPQVMLNFDTRAVLSSSGESATSNSYQTRNASLGLRQTIFSVEDRLLIQQAEIAETLGELAANQADMELNLRLTQTYLNVLSGKAEFDLIKARLENLERLLQLITKRMAEGRATVIEQKQIEAELLSSRTQKLVLQTEVDTAMSYLNELVGVEVKTVQELKFTHLIDEFRRNSVQTWLDRCLAFDLEAKRRATSIRLAEKEIQRAKAQFLPIVYASGSFSKGRAIYPDGVASNLNANAQTNRSIGMTISIPLFNGFGSTAKLRQMQASKDQALADKDVALQQARMRAQTLVIQTHNDFALIEGAEQASRASLLARDAVLRSFELGKMNAFDVALAEEKFMLVSVAEIRKRYQFYQRLLTLFAIAGTLDAEHISRM